MMRPLTPQMNEQVSRVDLTAMYPPFVDLYLDTLEACAGRGYFYWCISSKREDPEQAALYAKGRAKQPDGSWIIVNKALIVTNAKPGESDHGFGIGADSSLDKNADRHGLQPSWDMASYQVLAEEAKRRGLNALYYSTSFPEGPHVGLPLFRYGITHLYLQKLKEQGGIPAVWRHLDGFDWTSP